MQSTINLIRVKTFKGQIRFVVGSYDIGSVPSKFATNFRKWFACNRGPVPDKEI